MSALTCELCGSSDVVKQGGYFVCQQCGTKYTLEEARKLLGNGGNEPTAAPARSAAPAADQELQNLYQLARRAKADNNGENAAKYYDMILIKDPNNWEAAFYTVYFKATECKIAQIRSAAISVSNCEDSVLELIRDHVPEAEQPEAVREVLLRSQLIASMLSNGAKNHYDGIDSSIKNNYRQEYVDNACASRDIMYTCGTQIDLIFGDDSRIAPLAAEAWKSGIKMHENLMSYLANETINQNVIDSYVEKIEKYDPSFAKNYFYVTKKKKLEAEISSLRTTVNATEGPLKFKLGGCSIFFIVLGLGAIIFALAMQATFRYISQTWLVVLLIVLGVFCVIFALYFAVPRKAAKEARAKNNADAKAKLKQKEEELEILERRYR